MRTHLSYFGAVGDGKTDDTKAVRDALLCGKPLDWHGFHCLVREPLKFDTDGGVVDIDGVNEAQASLIFDGVTTDHMEISWANTKIRNLTVRGTGTQAGNAVCLLLCNCVRPLIENVHVVDYDNVGIMLHECDYGSVDRCFVSNSAQRYNAGKVGTAVQLSGCRGTRVTDTVALRTNFAFSILGREYTEYAESGYKLKIDRSTQETVGNSMHRCFASYFRGTPFNVNGCDANVYFDCTAVNGEAKEEYPAFQIKHPTNMPDVSFNKILACHVEGAARGYYMQGGSFNDIGMCSARDIRWFAARANLARGSRIWGIHADYCAMEDTKNVNGALVVRNSMACDLRDCVVGFSSSKTLASVEQATDITTGQLISCCELPTVMKVDGDSNRITVNGDAVKSTSIVVRPYGHV